MEIISNYFPSREKKYNKYEKCKKKIRPNILFVWKNLNHLYVYPQAVNSTQLLQSSSDSALFPPNTFHIWWRDTKYWTRKKHISCSQYFLAKKASQRWQNEWWVSSTDLYGYCDYYYYNDNIIHYVNMYDFHDSTIIFVSVSFFAISHLKSTMN